MTYQRHYIDSYWFLKQIPQSPDSIDVMSLYRRNIQSFNNVTILLRQKIGILFVAIVAEMCFYRNNFLWEKSSHVLVNSDFKGDFGIL